MSYQQRPDVPGSMATLKALWKPGEPMGDAGVTAPQLAAQIAALREALQRLERISTDCRMCTHFEMGDCKKFGAAIPPEFQRTADACADWTYDGIPF